MKIVLLFTLILGSMSLYAQNACKDLLVETQPDPEAQIREEHLKALHTASKLIHQIVEKKFEMAKFLSENALIYGEYSSQKEKQLYLQKKESELRQHEIRWLHDYDLAIKSINPELPNATIRRISKSLVYNKNVQMNGLRDEMAKNQMEMDLTHERLTKAYAIWAPYDLSLKELERLELSMMETLKHLKEISGDDLTPITEVVNELKDLSLKESSVEECKRFLMSYQTLKESVFRPFFK